MLTEIIVRSGLFVFDNNHSLVAFVSLSFADGFKFVDRLRESRFLADLTHNRNSALTCIFHFFFQFLFQIKTHKTLFNQVLYFSQFRWNPVARNGFEVHRQGITELEVAFVFFSVDFKLLAHLLVAKFKNFRDVKSVWQCGRNRYTNFASFLENFGFI